MITLYGFGNIFPEGRGETKDLRAQWALEETGLPYRVHALDHSGGELDGDAYRRISPFRQVPVIDDDGFDIHAGIAGGHVLLFEGDDYIGPAANHASRLCEAAAPGEVLAVEVGPHLPDWVEVVEQLSVHAPGIGDLHGVLKLGVAESLFARRAYN